MNGLMSTVQWGSVLLYLNEKNGTLHAARHDTRDPVEETACGRTLGRDIYPWSEHIVQWPDLQAVVFTDRCHRNGCKQRWRSLDVLFADHSSLPALGEDPEFQSDGEFDNEMDLVI